MRVFDEELEVFGEVDVDYDRGVVFDVEVEIIEVFHCQFQPFHPILQLLLRSQVFLRRLILHMHDGLRLELREPAIEVCLFGLPTALPLVHTHILRTQLFSAVYAFLKFRLKFQLHGEGISLFKLLPFFFFLFDHFETESAADFVLFEKSALDGHAAYAAL